MFSTPARNGKPEIESDSVVSDEEESPARPTSWSDIKAGASNVQPRTRERMAMSTCNAQRAFTLDTLQELHDSLKTCPQEGTLAQDPNGLEVELLDHQRRALAWLMWRENQKPSGGILETEKGNTNEDHSERSLYEYHGGTEYFKMRQKLLHHNRVKDGSHFDILVLLLRLRQICCHPTLITAMLNEGDVEKDDNEEYEELNLLEQLNKLNIEDDNPPNQNIQNDAVTLKDGCKGFLNPKNLVFSNEYKSTKIDVLLKKLNEVISETEDKVVIVSQWPSFLRLIAAHLPKMEIEFDQLDGSVVVNKIMAMVDNFNDPKHKMN